MEKKKWKWNHKGHFQRISSEKCLTPYPRGQEMTTVLRLSLSETMVTHLLGFPVDTDSLAQ